LCALGTAGDTYPFIGIAQALRARGHRAVLIGSDLHRAAAERFGVEFVGVGDRADHELVYGSPEAWDARRGGLAAGKYFARQVRGQYAAIAARIVPGETVLVAQGLSFAARIAHDAVGVPLVTAHVCPGYIVSAADPPVLPFLRLPGWLPTPLARAVLRAGDTLFSDPVFATEVNGLRRELGLTPAREIYGRWMHSPQLILGLYPDWFAPPPRDVPHVCTSAFPLFDASEEAGLPAEVEQFLSAGSPPVLITQGSTQRDAGPMFSATVDACDKLGRRSLLVGPAKPPSSLPASCLHWPRLSFKLLMPRVSALIGHGGIGTHSLALAAGIPQLLLPRAHDQFDNAERFGRLGVARVLTPRRLTAERVRRELDWLLNNPSVGPTCRELAKRLPAAPLDIICARLEAFAVEVAKDVMR